MTTRGLDASFLNKYKDLTPPWGDVGYITYKRTYARRIEGLDRTEEWHETIARVCQGLLDIGGQFTKKELEQLYDHMFHLRGMVSGRALWQLGTDTVQKIGADSLQNCWHVAVDEPSAFTFTFNQLMLGGGVGFNIQPEYVYALSKIEHAPVVERVNTPDCDFIVPDNREGWVELLGRILDAHFTTGKNVRYYTKNIRAKGEPINGFGGTASGSEDLVKGIGEIVQVIQRRHRRKLRPIDCLDIMNIIGQIVVAGNVRRSAEIALGDPHDMDFLNAKNWHVGTMPNWRRMSNNSVVTSNLHGLAPEFWEGYERQGEPYGLINLDLCRRYGRLSDPADWRPDWGVVGVNPCAEITLESREPCNLAEIYLPNINDIETFQEVACLLYKSCKTISCFGFSDPRINAVVNRNHRIGIGVTGYQAARKWRGNREAFDQVYRGLEECDRTFSKQLGVCESVKLTTVKPSGTLSLLPKGCTPGVHAGYSQYMIRRIRFSADDPLVSVCQDHGFHVEPLILQDGSYDMATMVVSFPTKFDKHVTVEADLTVVDQLEAQGFLQKYWADNSVSATHYYQEDELPLLKEWLAENYDHGVKTCSFLKVTKTNDDGADGHGFVQAPLEKIDKATYQSLVKNTTPITSINDTEEISFADSLECAGGHCPVK